MARFTLVTSLPKFGHAGAKIAGTRTWNPRVFAAATPRPIQVPTSHEEGSITEGLKQGASETLNVGDNLQDKAYSTAERVTEHAKDAAGKVSATAQNIGEKAKQTMQEAWDSTKNMAQKAAGKAQESAETVKENAESVKKGMNSKN